MGTKVIRMATPQKDSRTGIYIFRRGIPHGLRAFMDGKWEYKVSLETRDPVEAKHYFSEVNAAFESMLDAARRLHRASKVSQALEIVDAYIVGWDLAYRQRTAMKLAMLEYAAYRFQVGIPSSSRAGERYDFGPPPTREDLRDHMTRKRMLESVEDFKTLPWAETMRRIRALPTFQPIQFMIDGAASRAGVSAPVGSPLYTALGEALIARLVEACVPKIEVTRQRLIPPEILSVPALGALPFAVPSTAEVDALHTTGHVQSDSGPTMRTVFDDWAGHKPRDPKLLDEWSTAIRRFDALADAPAVSNITAEMVREFRNVYTRLPSRAPSAIAQLPLREQVLIAERDDLRTLAPATVNKALSAIRVMLDHAVEEMRILQINVAKTVKGVEKDGEVDARLPFTSEDMKVIFTSKLPVKNDVSPETVSWALLLGPFTGCRLEELGKLRPWNVRNDRGIAYIAIERDRRAVRDREKKDGTPSSKRSKTQASYREIPIHPVLIEAGFLDLAKAKAAAGAEWIFDDLVADKYGSRTKRLSRVINDWLDAIGLSDAELVFHSFRHTVRRVLRGRADRDIVDLIAGHADGSVGSKYGRGAALEPLRDAINLIEYPEVDWKLVIRGMSLLSKLTEA